VDAIFNALQKLEAAGRSGIDVTRRLGVKLGFIILAHQDLHRTAQLVRFLTNNDCPVSLHIDQNASPEEVIELMADLNHIKSVVYPKREKCGWGQFSIVQATLNAAEVLLESHPDVTNVFMASGSCLPVRPIKQLKAFLERHKDIDFIESFSEKDEKWVKGGLDQERFTLYFPISWRKHRFAFDRLIDLQRILNVSRTVPKHVSPHMGSQWWCLTTSTLRKIIEDPDRQKNDRFFSKCWIPDESYFQSLARNHSEHIRPQSLTFSIFDTQGKPFLLYDDHLNDLPKTNAFFVRKVWPGSNKLYHHLLKTNRKNFPLSNTNEEAFAGIFSQANTTSISGGKGQALQGRFPKSSSNKAGMACDDFGVLIGFGYLFQDFVDWAREAKGLNVFQNIFKRRHFMFYKKIALVKGNLTADVKLRNMNPKRYLSNFLKSQKSDKCTAIMYDVSDNQKIMPDITRDEYAHFIVVQEAWLLSIANSEMKLKGKIMQARVLQARERKMLQALKEGKHASCTIFSLEDALNTPGLVLQAALQILDPEIGAQPTAIPQLVDTSKLDRLVRKLSKSGVSVNFKPDKKRKKPQKSTKKEIIKPYVVR
jgi:uncharacterized protein DUF5927/core-2/I-Branching enzyme